MVCNVDKYFLYTQIFPLLLISVLLKTRGPAHESDNLVFSLCVHVALVSWICDMLMLLIVTHYSSVLCFCLKLQQGHLSHLRYNLPPLGHDVNFTLMTQVVSTFRLYVKLKSKFTTSVSEINLVRNLNLFTLAKRTVNCFSLGLMKALL